jgi:hypothetical protein
MAAIPHPEHEIAARLSRLEARAWPSVMIWKPVSSISGKWEAAGPDWTIIEESPVVFCDKLQARLGTRKAGEAPGEPGAS